MDANERLHLEWLGMAQPEGLVVTAAALKAAEANVTWPVAELQAALADLCEQAGPRRRIADHRALFRDLLGWSDDLLVTGADIPPRLRVHLDGDQILAPTCAVRSADDDGAFVLLIEETTRADLDAASDNRRWSATPHQRFERLLRETGVPAGLLTNGRELRLVHAPRKESAGYLSFRIAEMLTVDGRPLLGAFHMLLNQRRLVSLAGHQRLGALLAASRAYQTTVSTKLREQILAALRDLLLGFQRADRLANGAILGPYSHGKHAEVYKGLVTVLLRMVFILYAEEKKASTGDKNLLPMESALYAENYSLSRLHAQLVEDRGRHGDTIEDRYGAWGRVITLFRLLHDGVEAAGGLSIPARKGTFFNPDAYPFLEGRPRQSTRQAPKDGVEAEPLDLPRISDGVVFRVLDRLLMLDGERLQYKGLDVEQIGSVYEGLMGYEVEVAEGESLCLVPLHVVVDLSALLPLAPAERLKRLKEEAGLDLKGAAVAKEVSEARDESALEAALSRRISPRQPGRIAAGSLFLQPGEERRRTGSHYTPRALTEPIVATTLRPVLERLGDDATPEDILALKICDPAMGSGAFLVEACRQLADRLVLAWRRWPKTSPDLPPDEIPELHARRLIAQRSIYGVDKNPLAVDLARLSMWLVTMAKDHPFTFVDHALREGDSLVGLSTEQISSLAFDLSKGKQVELVRQVVSKRVARAQELREEIHKIGDPPDNDALAVLWDEAKTELRVVRIIGDAMIASHFKESSDKARKTALEEVARVIPIWLATGQHGAELQGMVDELHAGAKGVLPFHWEAEFPEVFRRQGGFDCVVGNPPFLGGPLIGSRFGLRYHQLLVDHFANSTGLVNLVAFFFRRAFALIAPEATFGLLATNTLTQGDTRSASLVQILREGGTIYEAQKRHRWPGEAAVLVSIVHVIKGVYNETCVLDGRPVERVTSYLFRGRKDSLDTEPVAMSGNRGLGYVGSKIWGAGFLFEETPTGGSSSLDDMNRVLHAEPSSAEVIFKYLGAEEFNTSPSQSPSRFVIDFGEMSEREARNRPLLFSVVEARVKPVRAVNKQRNYRDNWWLHVTRVPEAAAYMQKHGKVLVLAKVSKHLSAALVTAGTVISDRMILILAHRHATFAVVQSALHDAWARFVGSVLEDRLSYTTECIDTFPFPPGVLSPVPVPVPVPDLSPLETAGQTYYDHRSALMIANNEGLTRTYNRFHNPDDHTPGILRLRELHAAMDRAVLDAYGWQDILPVYDFRPQLDESTRFTWTEDTRDEVLARLLELNRTQAAREAEEAAAAEAKKPAKKSPAKKRAAKKEGANLSLPLGGTGDEKG